MNLATQNQTSRRLFLESEGVLEFVMKYKNNPRDKFHLIQTTDDREYKLNDYFFFYRKNCPKNKLSVLY